MKTETKRGKNVINESIIHGCRVYVEDGEVKTQFSEEIERNGYMDVETAKELTLAVIKKIYEMNNAL